MYDDRVLVEEMLHGDADAFACLVRKYQAPLLASAYHLLGHTEDAQDLAQETFIEAYRRLPTLREGEKLRGWLFAILRFKCLRFRRRRRHAEVPLEQIEDLPAAPTPALTDHTVWDALLRLPLTDREILAARYLQELSYAEIADVLRISVHNAEVRCARARTRLRVLVQGQEEEETRAFMQRGITALPLSLTGEAFVHRVIQEVTPMLHASTLTATTPFKTATCLAAKKSLFPHLLAYAAGWKAVAIVAIAVAVLGAARFVAPHLAKQDRTTTAAVAMLPQDASLAPVHVAAPATTLPADPPPLLASVPDPPVPSNAREGTVNAVTGAPMPGANTEHELGNAFSNKSLVTLSGRVVSALGKPISGANILVYTFQFGEQKTLELLSDAKGDFAVQVDPALLRQNLPDTPATVVAYAPGYTLIRAELKGSYNVITLNPGASVSGIVVDAMGKPLAGVPVRMFYCWDPHGYGPTVPEEWRAHFTVHSAADGTWTLPGIPLAGKAALVLDDDRFVHEQQEITLVAGEPAPAVRFMVRPGATVTGRVLTPKGAPATDARVNIGPPSDDTVDTASNSNCGKTAQDGSYRITGLESGNYTINAVSEKQAWIAEPLKDITLAEGKQTDAPDLHTRIGAVLEGTVVDAESGLPIPMAYIGLYHGKTIDRKSWTHGLRADNNGHFFHRTLPEQMTLLSSETQFGYRGMLEAEAVSVELREGDTVSTVLKLHKGLVVTGTVTDEEGQPAAGVTFFVRMPYRKDGAWSRNDTEVQFTTDQHGKFKVFGLPAGEGSVTLPPNDNDYAWEQDEPLAIEVPAKAPIAVTITRVELHTIRGRVVDTQHQPLAGVRATFWAPDTLTVVTGADGVYELPKIPVKCEVRLISLEKAGYRQLFTRKLTNAGKDTINDAVMARTTTVHGKVCDATGKPVIGATVVSVECGLLPRAVTDETGAFTLPEQPEGELHLVAATPTGGGLQSSSTGTDFLITCMPARVAKPVDIPLALSLLDADSKLPVTQRRFIRDDTLRAIADVELDTAIHYIMAGNEPMSDGWRAYLLARQAEQAPEKVDELLVQLNLINNADCKFYAAVEIGIAVAKNNPGLAEQLYRMAKPSYDRSKHAAEAFRNIEGLGTFADISLRTIALAGLLHKTADLDAMLTQLSTSLKEAGNKQMMIDALAEAAGRVSPEFVFKVYVIIDNESQSAYLDRAVVCMAQHDPKAALRLQQMIAAKTHKGASPAAICAIIDALGKKDAPAALALAKAQPENMRAAALLEAAAFQPKAAARALILDLFAKQTNQTMMNIAKANAIDPELGKELYAQYKESI